MDKFCDRLKQLRSEAGISMKQLAAEVDVSDAAICKWENGTAEPKVSYLIKLSEYFECTVDYLVGKTDEFGAVKGNGVKPPLKLTREERQLVASVRELKPNMKSLLQDTVNAWNKSDKTIE